MKKILVLCTGNSCRSQMAEGYLKHYAGSNALIYSAGIETHGVNPMAVKIMKEDGIDISNNTSNNVDEYEGIEFDYVITVCDNANELCPIFPSHAHRIHKNFPDPSKEKGPEQMKIKKFIEVRDNIKSFCKIFVKENL